MPKTCPFHRYFSMKSVPDPYDWAGHTLCSTSDLLDLVISNSLIFFYCTSVYHAKIFFFHVGIIILALYEAKTTKNQLLSFASYIASILNFKRISYLPIFCLLQECIHINVPYNLYYHTDFHLIHFSLNFIIIDLTF